ncbi:non-ribosomal peptide synthetase [Micromonospora rifamycinica]|nr:non-ribosomal peptide synthetase [Micromonospora rifamycinica]KWV34296.1 hypothetical protein AWV63_02645 [Micromonospora rifamycinica]
MSYGQQRLWMINRLDPASDAYNVPFRIEIDGPLDLAALQSSLGDLVARHEVLRTRYPCNDDTGEQVIVPAAAAVPRLVYEQTTPEQAEEALVATCREPFDLTTDLPVRARVWRTGVDRFLFLLVIHHIATDGVSTGPLCRDLGAAYAARRKGAAPDLPPLPIQYADFALWQRELLGSEDDPGSLAHRQIGYWRDRLRGLEPQLSLPTDRALPNRLGTQGVLVVRTLPAGLHQRLIAIARGHGTTLFTVLQSAIAAFLTRTGSGTDIPLGSPVAGRGESDLDDLVGFFVNSLVFRIDTGGDPSFDALIDRAHQVTVGALSHQDLPFERLVDALNPRRSLALHPFFQVMFTLQSAVEHGDENLTLDGCVTSTEVLTTDNAKFALSIGIAEEVDPATGTPAGLTLRWSFNADVFDADTADTLLDSFTLFLRQVVAHPGRSIWQASLIGTDTMAALLAAGGVTGHARPTSLGTLDELFWQQARRRPRATALVDGDRTVMYGELAERAGTLATALRTAGAGPGQVVPILLERGTDMVASLLAVLRTGAAYTLLDPDYPNERLRSIRARCGGTLVVTRGDLVARIATAGVRVLLTDDLPAAGAADTWPSRPDAMPACVLFTSGSTGEPKGVLVPHRAMVATLREQSYARFGPGEVFLQCSPVSWDGFSLELFGALLFGGLCVLQPGQRPEPARVAAAAARHGVTMLQLSASLFNFLADEHPETFDGLTQVFTGGEAASVRHVRAVARQRPDLRIGNGYGPAESMGFTTCHQISPEDLDAGTIPIGRPVAHKRAYVLDARLQPVPPGVVGEIYLAGDGLATGYLGDAPGTAIRFVADPFGAPGDRMYRTGDLGRWHGGVLTYRGRSDDQVKIRGFRVEPNEVNAAVAAQPGVQQSAVVVAERTPGDRMLVAYVVGTGIAPAAVRQALAAQLPEHLVPGAVVVVPALPRTATGKLDLAALPAVVTGSPSTGREPRDDIERRLCHLYRDVLGVEQVDIDDNFFELGGHSLLAARLINRIRAALGRDVDLATVFAHPTVAGLGPAVASAPGAAQRPRLRRMT